MTILRKAVRIRVICGQKMQNKDDMICQRVEGSTQMSKDNNLNQQRDLDLGHKFNTTDSETKLCKAYGTDGSWIGNKYGGGL